MRVIIAGFLLFALAACGAPEAQTHGGAIAVENAWVAPTPGGVDVAAGYLTITNETAAADRLVSVSSPRAANVSVHEMSMDGGIMRMREMDGLDIPAGEQVTLQPSGLHLMFTGVNEPFVAGETVPIHLQFEHGGGMDVTAPVQHGPPSAHQDH